MKKRFVYPRHLKPCKAMVFVDGENLAIRYKELLGEEKPLDRVHWERDVYVWAEELNIDHTGVLDYTRHFYYTSVKGDDNKMLDTEIALKKIGIEDPRVFKRPSDPSRKSKAVDIQLTVEMLSHAYNKNYDVAILVAGDGDYVPLVKAVRDVGRRVFLWFFEESVSEGLEHVVDYSYDIGSTLLGSPESRLKVT